MATSKVLSLYKSIEGVEFQGTYANPVNIPYDDGYFTTRELVEVVSPSTVTKKMKEIVDSDPKDCVWKAITGKTFWAESISGKVKEGVQQTFKITNIDYSSDLNWQRKKYDAVFNITLTVVENNEED